MKKICLGLLLLIPLTTQAQTTTDLEVQTLILKALDGIYNYEFNEAEVSLRQIKTKYPQHPVNPILNAIRLYWQYMPIKGNGMVTHQYIQYLNQGISQSNQYLSRDEEDPEGVFFALTGHAYLSMKYNFDDEMMKAVGEARRAYTYLRRGFKLMEKNPEFYFTTGLYNYYAERYPLDHPAVKPFMLFFQDGDMPLGLRQMEIAVRKGVFTRVETALYLGHIYLEHENQPGRAAILLRPFADKYPNNPLFNLRCAEALMLAGQYAEAQPYIQRLKELPQQFLAMPVKVLEGMTQEKMTHNLQAATVSYQVATKMSFDVTFTKEFSAHAYAGLARLAARAGDRSRARSFYKKTLNLAEYKSTISEAKNYIKS